MPRTAKPLPPDVRLSRPKVRRVVETLLRWFDAEKRDLPWRRTRDPYAILVSEFMLQQTQVAAVVPYYQRFLEAFPTVEALAQSPEQEALRLWAGLGYYSRARHLRAAARKIVADYEGRVPSQAGDLLFLPGVGTYVAGAVASIAFGARVPALDANAIRVLSRLFAREGNPSSPRMRRDLESLAGQMIPADRPGDFNQALMELGARVCAAARASCDVCPLRALCQAAAKNNPLDYPAPARKPETVEVEEACAVVRRGGRYLVTQRPGDAGRYRNMWEFPHVAVSENSGHKRKFGAVTRKSGRAERKGGGTEGKSKGAEDKDERTERKGEGGGFFEKSHYGDASSIQVHIRPSIALGTRRKGISSQNPPESAACELAKYLRNAFGISIRVEQEWAEIRHQVTHHKIRKRVFLCSEDSGGRRAGGDAAYSEGDRVRWATLEEIGRLPLGAPHKRILALLDESERLFSL